jgi:hypothetical protein
MKLNIGQVLREGWDFLTKNPIILLVAFSGVLIGQRSLVYISVLGIVVSSVYSFVTFFLMTQYVYEARQGRPSWKGAFQALLPKLFFLFVTTLIFIIAIIVGTCFLIIPGIIVVVRLGAYDYAVMFDNAGIMDSFKKSWALTQGSFWRIFAVILILSLPFIIAGIIPKTNFFLALSMWMQTFSEVWWTVTMALVYFELKKIKEVAV